MSKSGVSAAVAAAAIVLSLAAPAVADDVAEKAQACNACHGANGTTIGPTIPVIWGQQSNYLYKELQNFHSGERKNAIMSATVGGIALPDLRQLADYFAAKSWPAQSGANPDAPPPAAIADKIQMCKACHQPHFEGGAPAPRLAGLSADYLAAQMDAFADGRRTNNLDMPGFMKALSEDDRKAMAKYLSGL